MARVTGDTDAVAAIHQVLDGEEWSTDTIVKIAEIVVRTGRPIRTPGDHSRNDISLLLDSFVDLTEDQLKVVRELWQALNIENDDVPQLPLRDAPDDGPGCKRDARGRKYYSSEWQ